MIGELRSHRLSSVAKVKVKSLSRVPLFATPWTVAYHAPPSMGFSRLEYWSGLPFPSPEDLPNLGLLHCRQTLYHLSHKGSPGYMHSSLYLSKSFKVYIFQISFSATSFLFTNAFTQQRRFKELARRRVLTLKVTTVELTGVDGNITKERP